MSGPIEWEEKESPRYGKGDVRYPGGRKKVLNERKESSDKKAKGKKEKIRESISNPNTKADFSFSGQELRGPMRGKGGSP